MRRRNLPVEDRIAATPPDYICYEKATIHDETPTPTAPWFVERNGVKYKLSMPDGSALSDGFLVTRDGRTLVAGWLYVPRVTCHPHPGKPIHPGGYAFWNPPLGVVQEDGSVLIDPAEALRQMVAEEVLPQVKSA